MAAITLTATQQRELIRKRIKHALRASHDLLDAFVSERMRRVVAHAGRTSSTAALVRATGSESPKIATLHSIQPFNSRQERHPSAPIEPETNPGENPTSRSCQARGD